MSEEDLKAKVLLIIESERLARQEDVDDAIARHTQEAGGIGVMASAVISIWCLLLVCIFEFLAK